MSYKACVYKGCDNYTYNSTPCANKEFTIFRFPRDPARYEQWIKRGKVLEGLPERQMLMCSDHFEDKYLIRNNKRTILTSTAVPFHYPEENEDVESDDNIGKDCKGNIVKVSEELNSEMVFSIHGDMEDGSELIRLKETLCGDDNEDVLADYDKVDNLDEEYCVESTMKDDDEQENEIADEYTVDSDYQDGILDGTITQPLQKGYIIKSYTTKPSGRHKTSSGPDEAQEPSSSKMIKSNFSTQGIVRGNNAPTLKRNMKRRSEETNNSKRVRKEVEENLPESPEASSKSLINSEAVTCFIFKGEEYVQMPKEYYVQEKLELFKKIEKYEKVLRIFKQNLLDFDFS
ncbi:unnamed protein product [Ceratitis capitata]|uniref:(Mediterranean fruit fly) hypothetical protein n=1 Tax=Ceratitis capitata TaxID=7213 RepID=W8BGU5_CERCA|nr:unnamed protein product [Ceratitis capitata]